MNRDTEARALCWGKDPELWFPERQETRKKTTGGRRALCAKATSEAIAICYQCPIRVQCLKYALDHDMYGIWGGLTDAERAKLNYQKPAPPPEVKAKPKVAMPASEVKGVTWSISRLRWLVMIVDVPNGNKKHWVGTFGDKESAEQAALATHQRLGTDPRRVGAPPLQRASAAV